MRINGNNQYEKSYVNKTAKNKDIMNVTLIRHQYVNIIYIQQVTPFHCDNMG